MTISGANATVSGNLSVSGTGSFTGQVTIPATPSASTDAASKGYVDSQVGANNELSEVLANGNTTGGTDIAITAGDKITNFTSTGIDDNATSTALTIDSSENSTFASNVSLISSSTVNLRVTNGAQNIYIGSSGSTRFGLSSGASIIQSTSAAFGIGTQDGQNLTLGTDNTARLTILSGGNIGIGTTSPLSGNKLDVRGGNIMVGGFGGGTDYGLILTPDDGSGYWNIANVTGGALTFNNSATIGSSEAMRIS